MKNIKYLIITMLAFVTFNRSGAQSIDEGRRFTRNEQYEDAEKIFNELIAANPKKGDPYYWAGINFLERGDSNAAREVFDRGLVNSPKFTLNYVGKGHLLLREGKKTEAEAQFLLALKAKKKMRPMINREIGRAYLLVSERSKSEMVENAKTALTYLEKASQEDFEVLLLQGDALFVTNPVDAGAAITKYIESGYLSENDPRPLLREALLYQKVKNFDISMVRVDEGLAKDDAFAPGYRQKADLYSEMKKRDSAVMYYREYLKRNNNLSARRKFINALFYNGEFDEVIKESKELLKVKEYTNLYGVISYAIVEKKDTVLANNQEGLDYFEIYEQKHVGPAKRGLSASEKFYKGLLLYRTNQIDAGWALMREALADTAHSAQRWYDMAREETYFSRRYDQAIEVIRLKELKNREMSPLDMYYLAMSYRMNEQYENSNSIFSEIIKKDSTYIKGYYYIALNWHTTDPNDSTGNVSAAYMNWMSRLSAEEREKTSVKRDIENAYRAMADFNDRKAAKMYKNPEDKAAGYPKTIALYKKAIENYKMVMTYAPDDEEIGSWLTTLEGFVANLEKRSSGRR